jgi:hypothetical protein
MQLFNLFSPVSLVLVSTSYGYIVPATSTLCATHYPTPSPTHTETISYSRTPNLADYRILYDFLRNYADSNSDAIAHWSRSRFMIWQISILLQDKAVLMAV